MCKDDRLPEYAKTAYWGDLGVRIVANIVSDELNMIFRSKEKVDLGIDGEIEIVDDNRRGTGRLIAVQIKCGKSFFREKNNEGYVFRCPIEKFNYWINLAVPVILTLCNPDTREVFWCRICTENAIKLKESYKIIVPINQKLGEHSLDSWYYVNKKHKLNRENL